MSAVAFTQPPSVLGADSRFLSVVGAEFAAVLEIVSPDRWTLVRVDKYVPWPLFLADATHRCRIPVERGQSMTSEPVHVIGPWSGGTSAHEVRATIVRAQMRGLIDSQDSRALLAFFDLSMITAPLIRPGRWMQIWTALAWCAPWEWQVHFRYYMYLTFVLPVLPYGPDRLDCLLGVAAFFEDSPATTSEMLPCQSTPASALHDCAPTTVPDPQTTTPAPV